MYLPKNEAKCQWFIRNQFKRLLWLKNANRFKKCILKTCL